VSIRPGAVRFFKELHSLEHLLERQAAGEILVVEQDGVMVGTGAIVAGEISGVFIHPEFQKRGIGGREVARESLDRRRRGRTLRLLDGRRVPWCGRVLTSSSSRSAAKVCFGTKRSEPTAQLRSVRTIVDVPWISGAADLLASSPPAEKNRRQRALSVLRRSKVARPRALYVSSSIGLGHVSKDLAIAAELRRLDPSLEILWLAGPPASDALREAGENVLPEASRWRGASRIAERCLRGGRLDLVRYVYRSLPAWAMNACLFRRVVGRYDIDIAIGNEAYEVDIPLVAHMLRLQVPFVMIFDFVGTDAMTARVADRLGAWILNALWSLDRFVYTRAHHSAMFIGELEDVPARSFGWGLPGRREYASKYYHVVGHVVRFSPDDYTDRLAWRHRLGYGDEPLVVCSVGGTSIGRELLELCGAAAVPLRALVPGVRVVLVAGPRIAVDSVIVPEGVDVFGYVPRLYELFASCDVAVVQCGASATTELAALGTPFIYAPIDGHFEQEIVAARLARYATGRRMSLHSTTAGALAGMIFEELGRVSLYPSMPVDGATRAARHVLAILDEWRSDSRGATSSEVRASGST
jgi:hypothetical protein